MNLSLLKNPDILSWASDNRNNQQKVIGFALETNNEEENALSKLERKNLDMIVLNSTQDEDATFGGDLNKVTIFDKNGNKTELPLQSKLNIGIELINIISTFND
jgi:phosphopantothenoylcysteine decarboxylase/phosphopantothenate--cysteine ligase